MSSIILHTIIHAPIKRCFDLSRSIDLHMQSTEGTNEKAVAGKTTGLIDKGETVTWEATHFGVRQRLKSEIREMKMPYYFSDDMLEGAFKMIHHEHHFKEEGDNTTMTDIFNYDVPYGYAGKLFDVLVLKSYMTKFLLKRNELIKSIAESDEWRAILL